MRTIVLRMLTVDVAMGTNSPLRTQSYALRQPRGRLCLKWPHPPHHGPDRVAEGLTCLAVHRGAERLGEIGWREGLWAAPTTSQSWCLDILGSVAVP